MAATSVKPLPDCTDLNPAWTIADPRTAARVLAAMGAPTVEHRGGYWERHHLRFFTPVDPLRPQAGDPPRLSAGHWTVCAPERATTRIPMTLVTDLPGYGADRLHKDVRYRIRRAARRAHCVALTTPEVLLAQGWPIMRQSAAKSGQPLPRDVKAYREGIGRRFDGDPQLILAAMDAGTLLAWMTAHAVGSTLRMTEMYIGERGRRMDVGILLYWAVLSRGAAQSGIEVAHLGPWFPERPNLLYTKSRVGTRLVDVPARGHIQAPLRPLLARTRPVAFQRWGGAGLDGPRPAELRDLPLWDPTRHRFSP